MSRSSVTREGFEFLQRGGASRRMLSYAAILTPSGWWTVQQHDRAWIGCYPASKRVLIGIGPDTILALDPTDYGVFRFICLSGEAFALYGEAE